MENGWYYILNDIRRCKLQGIEYNRLKQTASVSLWRKAFVRWPRFWELSLVFIWLWTCCELVVKVVSLLWLNFSFIWKSLHSKTTTSPRQRRNNRGLVVNLQLASLQQVGDSFWPVIFWLVILCRLGWTSRVSEFNRPLSFYLFWYRLVDSEKQKLRDDRLNWN